MTSSKISPEPIIKPDLQDEAEKVWADVRDVTDACDCDTCRRHAIEIIRNAMLEHGDRMIER